MRYRIRPVIGAGVTVHGTPQLLSIRIALGVQGAAQGARQHGPNPVSPQLRSCPELAPDGAERSQFRWRKLAGVDAIQKRTRVVRLNPVPGRYRSIGLRRPRHILRISNLGACAVRCDGCVDCVAPARTVPV